MRTILGVIALAGAGGFGVTMLHYGYLVMAQAAWIFITPILAWIALNIAIILGCQRSRHAPLKLFGEVWGKVFQYTALAQGVLYTVLVIWPLAIMFGWDGPPESKAEFLTDFGIGAAYISMFIFGATGGGAAASAVSAGSRWLGIGFALLAIALPLVLMFVFEAETRAFIADRELAFCLAVVAYLLVMSIIGMWLVVKGGGEGAADPSRFSRLP